MSHKINITRIKAVSNALGELKEKVVFVGGATVSLYADRMAEEVRPTDDVDILVELWSRGEFLLFEEQLRKRGFKNDRESKFVGRYLLPGIIVDVMSTDENILGFSNRWYADGLKTSVTCNIDEMHSVRIFSSPLFIASKLEAFKNRGENDGRTSSDFEDIVYVLENRRSIWEEMITADTAVKTYLKDEFKIMLANPYIVEWIDCHVSFNSPPSTYFIMEQMDEFVKQNG